MALKFGASGAAALVLALSVAASARAQGYSDDYICKHGNPADGRTADACDRIGEPVPSGNDRADAQPYYTPEPQPAEESADFQHGLADRQRYETWFHALLGDYLVGATYWESNRSIRNAAGCLIEGAAASAEWRAGCVAAQAQLRESDTFRRSSPDYREGWNSYQEGAASPEEPAPLTNAAPAADNQAAPAPAPVAAITPPVSPPNPANPSPSVNGALIAGVLIAIVVILLGLTLYFLPTLIAAGRRKRNALAIFALNLFLGWTLLGWVLALVWSLSVDAQPPARA